MKWGDEGYRNTNELEYLAEAANTAMRVHSPPPFMTSVSSRLRAHNLTVYGLKWHYLHSLGSLSCLSIKSSDVLLISKAQQYCTSRYKCIPFELITYVNNNENISELN
jgi:hypothetical protein